MSEVERIWIEYDMDNNGTLDFDEIASYLKKRAYPHLTLGQDVLRKIFDLIDENGDNTISKEEMRFFLHLLVDE